jgi:hypothetical protein
MRKAPARRSCCKRSRTICGGGRIHRRTGNTRRSAAARRVRRHGRLAQYAHGYRARIGADKFPADGEEDLQVLIGFAKETFGAL